MTRSYWLGLGFIATLGVAAACGDGPVAAAAPTAGTTGQGTGGAAGSGAGGSGGQGLPTGAGVGDDCSDSVPCRPGLTCNAESVCEPGYSLGAGEACVIGPECQQGLQCLGGMCVPAGEGDVGDACLGDAQCMSGLRCGVVGFSGQCVPAGEGDVGNACEAHVDCYGGLVCLEGACTPGIPMAWDGVDCEDPVESPVRAYFEVPGAEEADEGDFFRLPFPNDARLKGGKVDLSGFPTPGPGLIGVDLVKSYVDAVEANDSGFGAYSTVLFRFSGNVTVDSLREDGVINFVDITPGAAEYGESEGHGWYYWTPRTPYVCDNWIGIRRPNGVPMRPGHTYAVYLTTGAKNWDGGAIQRAENLVSVLSNSTPSDDALKPVHTAYKPFRDYLADESINAATILNAAVFTVAPVQDPMAEVAAAIEDLPAPTADDWVKCADGVDSPCSDAEGARACGSGTADYDEYHALVSLPIFQEGEAPYTTSGGQIAVSDDPPREDVCLSLTVPKGTMPAEGWPIVVFAHGTGGSFRSHLRPEVAGVLSAASPAFAVLGIDQVVHGPRRGDSSEAPENLFFNFQNPDAARGNPIQGAADQLSLARFAAALDLSASESGGEAIKADPDKIYFFGHSQGSTEGSLALPFSSVYKAAVLSGNGGSLMDALLTKTKPVDIKSVMPFVLSDPTVSETGLMHPVLSLLQQWIDPGDPLNFALSVTREPIGSYPAKHVFQTFGLDDTYSPPETMRVYAVAGILPHVTPLLTDLGLPGDEAPAQSNVSVDATPYTLGVRQYEPSGDDDGHFVVFDVAAANADMVRFFETATTGEPQIGE